MLLFFLFCFFVVVVCLFVVVFFFLGGGGLYLESDYFIHEFCILFTLCMLSVNKTFCEGLYIY